MVFGRLVKKIKEERMARKAEKKLKQIEERRKIEKEKKKLIKMGLDEYEAEVLAKKRVKGKKKKSVLDTIGNIVDAFEGGSTRSRKSGKRESSRKSSKSKKSSKRTGRGKSVFDDLNDYFNELDRAFGKGGLL